MTVGSIFPHLYLYNSTETDMNSYLRAHGAIYIYIYISSLKAFPVNPEKVLRLNN